MASRDYNILGSQVGAGQLLGSTSSHAKHAPSTAQIVDSQLLKQLQKAQEFVKIENVRNVASYSWLDSSNPKIVIPGLPPRWTPPRVTPRLNQDSGSYFRDQNAARNPKYPMEPAVRAVLTEQDWPSGEDVRVFACGSTLGNLLRVVRQQSKDFCFRVETVGKTTFFIRKENSPTQLIEGVYGYGHAFPEAYTTWDPDVKKSESHQKIIQYEFGGKSMMVRFEADGYLPDKVKGPAVSVKSPASSQDLDSLLDGLRTKPLPANDGSLEITSGGHGLPQAAIFDLKTRSNKKVMIDVIGEELPRLWINQIPNFILAFHQRGVFNDIRIKDVRNRIREFETSLQDDLRMFSGLLDHICAIAEKMPGKRLEVSCRGGEELQLKTVGTDTWTVLPDDLKREWAGA